MVRVDTLTFARRLRDSGVPSEQAEAHAMAVHDYVQDFVTKDDLVHAVDTLKGEIDKVRGEMDRLAQRITIRLGGLIVVGIGALAALIKLGA